MRSLVPEDFARNREPIAYLAIGAALSAVYFVVPASPYMQARGIALRPGTAPHPTS
jgi:hypothetical protein